MKLYEVFMLVPNRRTGEGKVKTSLLSMANDEQEAKEHALNFLGIENDSDFTGEVEFVKVVEVVRDPNNEFGYIPVK